MDAELYELLLPGFMHESSNGRDAFGNKTYATAVEFDGHYEAKRRSMGSQTSVATAQHDAEKVEAGVLICESWVGLEPGDKVTVPDGSVAGRTLYVGTVETESDEEGPYYQEAALEELR